MSGRKIRSGLLLGALLALIFSALLFPMTPGSAVAAAKAVGYLAVFSVASYLIGARRKWLVAYGILAACVWIIGLTGACISGVPPALEITRDGLLVLLQLMLVLLVFRFSMFDPDFSQSPEPSIWRCSLPHCWGAAQSPLRIVIRKSGCGFHWTHLSILLVIFDSSQSLSFTSSP